MAEQHKARRDLYADVTNQIIAALEAGTPPWRRPWDPSKAGSFGGPINGTTNRPYRGINTLLLGMSPLSFGSGDPRWLTFKQAQEKGWMVRKGSKASTVVFFKKLELGDRADGNADERERRRIVPVLRSYPVFHASQVEGISDYVPPTPGEVSWRTPEAAATILAASGVPVRTGGDRAFYSPSTDHIQLPTTSAFHGPDEWAATALHELGHASGHPSRLNRDLRGRFGSNAYAMEELRAEIASAMMAAELGIPSDIPQHASYVASWLEVLRHDRRAIFGAASDAQKIADWCLERHPDYALAMEYESLADEVAEPPVAEPSPPPRPAIPAAVAALGPMPRHIARKLNPELPVTDLPMTPTPALEEAPSWGYRPR
jgi:antirestriction protein ArdC